MNATADFRFFTLKRAYHALPGNFGEGKKEGRAYETSRIVQNRLNLSGKEFSLKRNDIDPLKKEKKITNRNCLRNAEIPS